MERDAWERAHEAFLSSLERFSVMGEDSSSAAMVSRSAILPIHGEQLGNLELGPPAPRLVNSEEAEFKTRVRREKALYDLNIAFDVLREVAENAQSLNDRSAALEIYKQIVHSLTLDTPLVQLQMYHSILTVKPYEED